MKAFRYNSENRSDRKYNNCGKEKNPNAVKFYASNMDYANNYKFIYNKDGEVVAECSLEVVEIEGVALFDMNANFKNLKTYKSFVDSTINSMRSDYERALSRAEKARDKKMFQGFIDNLKNEEAEIAKTLISCEFQTLSDFERQNELVAELKELGFDGYTTNNEIAIF